MELSIENLKTIRRISEEHGGLSFWDLLEIFGSDLWDWGRLFPDIQMIDFLIQFSGKKTDLEALQSTI
jgi:hypothetical protein